VINKWSKKGNRFWATCLAWNLQKNRRRENSVYNHLRGKLEKKYYCINWFRNFLTTALMHNRYVIYLVIIQIC